MKRKILKKMLSFGFVNKSNPNRMIVFPPAKINIGLFVTERRTDGFHNLETLFYPLPFCDVLEVVATGDRAAAGMRFHLSGIGVEGGPGANLVERAYALMLEDHALPAVDVYLHKVIPPGSGLGGGSSDAAWMIRLMNDFAQLNLNAEAMHAYAASLGSDCPFFLQDRPAMAYGRGDVLEPLGFDLKGCWVLLYRPPQGISTVEAYRNLVPAKPIRSLAGISREDLLNGASWVGNDFEAYARSRVPEIGRIIDRSREHGAVYASLSGSGSAVYALYNHHTAPPADLQKYLIWQGCL